MRIIGKAISPKVKNLEDCRIATGRLDLRAENIDEAALLSMVAVCINENNFRDFHRKLKQHKAWLKRARRNGVDEDIVVRSYDTGYREGGRRKKAYGSRERS